MQTKIILEFGCNHQGNIDYAKQMIDQAKELEVWAVKLQKRDIDSIPDYVKNKQRSLNDSFGLTYYEHRKALEFDIEQMFELKSYAETKGLVFICSAFDEKSVDVLTQIGCEYIKLPSQLYSDENLKVKLLSAKEICKTKILLSTGMHSAEEILNNTWMQKADIIFHCISVYPHYVNEMNLIFLNALVQQSGRHGFTPGYSSHDVNGYGIPYAVMAGAKIIERHYTLDKKLKGSDHATVSSDYTEMKAIINSIKATELTMGDSKRECSNREKKTRLIYRGF